jgi:triacylglycerol lipase
VRRHGRLVDIDVVETILTLQTILRLLLLTEAILYGWLYCALEKRGVNGSAIVAVVLLIALCWRLSHALASFVVTSGLRFRDGRTLPWGSSLAALDNELRARLVCFNWSQPFDALALGPDPCGRKDGVPILLVHGLVCNRGLWVTFRKRLAAAGLGPVYTVSLTPLFGSIDELVPKLETRIEAICAETGASRILLVAHSMGGLVTRAYLAGTGGRLSRIAALATLGTPHHGTRLGQLGIGINIEQMREHSAWLQALEAAETAHPNPPPALSIYTLNDDLVYPSESSVLEWAENVPVSGVGHMGLVFSIPVAARVIEHFRSIAAGLDNSGSKRLK